MTLTAEQVKRATAVFAADRQKRLAAIIQEICDLMGVTPAHIKGRGCTPVLRAARVQIYLCAHEAHFTATEIANAVGRGSSTVAACIARNKAGESA